MGNDLCRITCKLLHVHFFICSLYIRFIPKWNLFTIESTGQLWFFFIRIFVYVLVFLNLRGCSLRNPVYVCLLLGLFYCVIRPPWGDGPPWLWAKEKTKCTGDVSHRGWDEKGETMRTGGGGGGCEKDKENKQNNTKKSETARVDTKGHQHDILFWTI